MIDVDVDRSVLRSKIMRNIYTVKKYKFIQGPDLHIGGERASTFGPQETEV